MTTKALREQRAKLVEDAGAILTKAKTDKRDMTGEERSQWEKLHADADKLLKDIETEERQEAANASVNRAIESRAARGELQPSNDPAEVAQIERRAFLDYCANGINGMSDENRAIMQKRRRELGPDEKRAAQTITTTGGGYTIPTGFVAQLEKSLLAFSNMRQVCRVLRTDGGNPLQFPTVNDTTNKATLTSINTQTTETALVFGQVTLDAYAFRSLILVPFELLQDTAIDLEAYIREALAERIARGTEEYFTTGSGSSQPQGIVGASSAGRTAAASTAISYADLVALEHSVDPAYRNGASFMFHDTVLRSLKELVDSDNRPLWKPGLTTGDPDRINGYPYAINQNMAPLLSTVGKTVLFGQMKKFMIRDVNNMIMLRLTERYADYAQVGFFVFSRHDSELVDAGTDPMKHLVMPSP
jgi:HK97 family phage major capsid protein